MIRILGRTQHGHDRWSRREMLRLGGLSLLGMGLPDLLRAESILPTLDQTYSALCEDLEARGLLDETLVIVMGEMGRSPQVNARAGRDHWSYVHNILLTGAGVKKGFVYGSSDYKGAQVESNPVKPADFIATVYAAMGIDPGGLIEDVGGRFRPMVPEGRITHGILA